MPGRGIRTPQPPGCLYWLTYAVGLRLSGSQEGGIHPPTYPSTRSFGEHSLRAGHVESAARGPGTERRE